MPTSSIYCLDASIVVRLLLDPSDPVGPLWRSWQQEGALIVAPTLLHYEVTNALYQQQRQKRFSAEIVEKMLRTAQAFPIQLYSDPALHALAHRLATDYTLPAAYDAHYLVVAQHFDAQFWTGDKRLAAAIGDKLSWLHYIPPGEISTAQPSP